MFPTFRILLYGASSIHMFNNCGGIGAVCTLRYSWTGENSELQLHRIHKWISHKSRYLKLQNYQQNI